MRFQNNPLFWIVVAGLATWRLTSILHREKIAKPIRRAVGIMQVAEDEEDPDFWIYPDNFVGNLFECSWCISVWIGGLVTILLLVLPVLIIPFALSAIAIFLYSLKGYLDRPSAIFVEEVYEDEEEPLDPEDEN